MTQRIWIDLRKLLPKGKRPVLLFNPGVTYLELLGHPFTVSNTDFARENAITKGYTHWAPIPYPLPRKKKR